jgi:hypothetical protein
VGKGQRVCAAHPALVLRYEFQGPTTSRFTDGSTATEEADGSCSVTFTFDVLLLASSARADLQLKPKVTEYDLDGVKFKHLVFFDDDSRLPIHRRVVGNIPAPRTVLFFTPRADQTSKR